MNELIDILKRFNRKERFYLVGMALGNKDFSLSKEFREKLKSKLNLEIPYNVFAAMDYHIDWIYASLLLYQKGKSFYEKDENITATQEDIDFLIAFWQNGGYHLIMLEAKGETGFSNRQMNHKAKRLGRIFGPKGDKWQGITPHFAIVSPNEPQKLKGEKWPHWMKPNNEACWIKMDMPSGLIKVTRCDEGGGSSKSGKYWKIEQR